MNYRTNLLDFEKDIDDSDAILRVIKAVEEIEKMDSIMKIYRSIAYPSDFMGTRDKIGNTNSVFKYDHESIESFLISETNKNEHLDTCHLPCSYNIIDF